MATFADFQVNARVPARYRDARSGLRFRVVAVTEQAAPDLLATTEIGDGLLAALMWERIAVTTDTTPVVGAGTVSGFEIMMVMCEELFDVDGTGVSPFIWWWNDDNYWRVTDRSEDGTIEFRHHMNVNAYHLAGAMHLANPCAECGRD